MLEVLALYGLAIVVPPVGTTAVMLTVWMLVTASRRVACVVAPANCYCNCTQQAFLNSYRCPRAHPLPTMRLHKEWRTWQS